MSILDQISGSGRENTVLSAANENDQWMLDIPSYPTYPHNITPWGFVLKSPFLFSICRPAYFSTSSLQNPSVRASWLRLLAHTKLGVLGMIWGRPNCTALDLDLVLALDLDHLRSDRLFCIKGGLSVEEFLIQALDNPSINCMSKFWLVGSGLV